MKKRKLISVAVIMCLLLGILSGCAGKDSGKSDTIKIGLIGPLTGNVAEYGLAVEKAAKLYIKELNEAGGIDGKQVTLISYDDKHDATESINAYNKLVFSDGVVAILGPVTSTPALAVAQASVADGIVLMTPTGTHPDITSYGTNVFRACFLDPYQGSTMATYAAKNLSAKTAAVIYNVTDSYSTGLRDTFVADCAKLGITVVANESYSGDPVNVASQLTNIAAKKPDVIFVPDYYNQIYLVAKQARDMGITSTLLGVDGADGCLGVDGADKSVLEGVIFSNHYSTDDPSPVVQNFLKSYESTYSATPSALSALGYDGARLLLSAIEKVAASGVELKQSAEFNAALIKTLEATDLDCVTGHITYDAQHNPVKTCAIIKIVGGKYTLDSYV